MINLLLNNVHENLKDGKYIAKHIPEYQKGQLAEIEFLHRFF